MVKLGKTEEHPPGAGDNRSRPIFSKVEIWGGRRPRWKITLGNGIGVIELPAKEVLQQGVFITRCFEKFNFPFKRMKADEWRELLTRAGENAIAHDENPTTSTMGQFKVMLSQYLTNRGKARRLEELLAGKPWEEADHNDGPRFWFNLDKLMQFLRRQNPDQYRNEDENAVAGLLRELGGSYQSKRVGERVAHAWWVPSSAVDRAPELAPQPPPKVEEVDA